MSFLIHTNQNIPAIHSNDMTTDQIKIHFKFLREDHYFPDDKDTRNIYLVYVKYKGNKTSFMFGDSIHNTQNGIILDDEKDKNTILENIPSDYHYTKENYPDYESFALEFGYDIDSRKGEKTYKKCLTLADKLHTLFNDTDIEAIGSRCK